MLNRVKLIAFILIIIMGVSSAMTFANAVNMLPPPPSNESDFQNNPPPANTTDPQDNVPPPINPSNNNEVDNPPPPPVPSRSQLGEDALRELWHVYREYNETNRLLSYAADKGISIDEVNSLLSYVSEFYNKALEMYNNGEYMGSKVYSHMALEALHGIRDLVTYQLALNGYAPPSPPPPPPP